MTEHRGTLNEDLWPLLVKALRPLGDLAAIEEIVEQLRTDGAFTSIEAPPPEHRMLEPGRLGDQRWYAVHDDDLAVLTGIATAIAVGGLTITAGISGLGALLGFLWLLRRKRIALEPLQGLVLQALIARPGKRGMAADLVSAMGLKTDRIEEILLQIKDLRRTDNQPGGLLERLPGGVWLALDV